MPSKADSEMDAVRERLPIPTVKLKQNQLPTAAIFAGVGALGLWLFFQLEDNRLAQTDTVFAAESGSATIASPADLRLPQGWEDGTSLVDTQAQVAAVRPAPTLYENLTPPAPPPPSIVERPNVAPPDYSVPQTPQYYAGGPPTTVGPIDDVAQPAAPSQASALGSALVYDAGVQRRSDQSRDRDVRSGQRSAETLRPDVSPIGPNILAQGSIIPAILETPLDTSKGGVVQAITTENMRGFGGNRVLIPAGSRLFGEFSAEPDGGNGRIAITWNRLAMADGRQVQIDFPTTDKQGANGIKGKRHTNALGRFATGLLQSALNIATFRALSAANSDTVVIGSSVQAPQIFDRRSRPQVRVTVPSGTKVNVLVARAIEF